MFKKPNNDKNQTNTEQSFSPSLDFSISLHTTRQEPFTSHVSPQLEVTAAARSDSLWYYTLFRFLWKLSWCAAGLCISKYSRVNHHSHGGNHSSIHPAKIFTIISKLKTEKLAVTHSFKAKATGRYIITQMNVSNSDRKTHNHSNECKQQRQEDT